MSERSSFPNPQYVSHQLWQQAKDENPDPTKFAPRDLQGFDELMERVEIQESTHGNCGTLFSAFEKDVSALQGTFQCRTKIAIERVKSKQRELKQKLIEVMVKLEKLKSIRARHQGYSFGFGSSSVLTEEEKSLRETFEGMRRDLARPNQFQGRLNELEPLSHSTSASMVQLPRLTLKPRHKKTGSSSSSSNGRGGSTGDLMAADDPLGDIHRFLDKQQAGLKVLVQSILDSTHDCDVILDALKTA